LPRARATFVSDAFNRAGAYFSIALVTMGGAML
jgi:hypothetical protein